MSSTHVVKKHITLQDEKSDLHSSSHLNNPPFMRLLKLYVYGLLWRFTKDWCEVSKVTWGKDLHLNMNEVAGYK